MSCIRSRFFDDGLIRLSAVPVLRTGSIAVLLVLSAGMVGSASAQSVDVAVRHFDEGNVRYRQGDYRGAVDSYQRAVDAGFVSGALFYNIGNAYYRLDDLGQTVRYYEKAADAGHESAELDHNREFVRSQTLDQFSRLPDPFWRPWWRFVVQLFGSWGLIIVGIACYFAAAVFLALRIWGGQTPWRRRLVSGSVVLAVVFLAAGFSASVEEETERRGVILIDEVALLEAPEGARSDLEIHEGLVVDVVVERGEWMEIRLPNGARGWIRSEALGLI